MSRLIPVALGLLMVCAGAYVVWLWCFERVYVRPDECVVLVRKTGAPLPPGQTIAEEGQKGIQRLTLAPGRYFINPLVYEIERHPLTVISAGDPDTWKEIYESGQPDYALPQSKGKLPEVGIVTSLAGKPWTESSEVVDVGFQGKWREVLTPGVYRLNPRAYKIERVPAVIVPLGCCGVVTSQLGEMPGVEEVRQTTLDPAGQPVAARPMVVQRLAEPGQRGVLKNVLPPGIYYVNPYVHKVRIVQIGYNLISELNSAHAQTEKIEFPSADGFTVDVEVTVVWGRHPRHVPELINRLGDVAKIQELIVAQIRSICRNIGSEYVSTDFIEGEKREQYQHAVTETLQKVCRERNLEILIALIHNIEVHARDGAGGRPGEGMADLKDTIQRGFIAREQDITRQKQRETATVRALLQTAEAEIAIAREEVASDARKQVAEVQAKAAREAAEIDAQRELEVAKIERQIAELEAETVRVLGRAEAEVARLRNEAEAAAKRLMVEAFGGGPAYNLYTFAMGFDPDSIRLIFAGEGTFWTDLSKLQDAATLELLKNRPKGN
jgi:hypothetical protein